MILKFCSKPSSFFNFLYFDNGGYKGAICDFHDNVIFEELMIFSNKNK